MLQLSSEASDPSSSTLKSMALRELDILSINKSIWGFQKHQENL